MTPTVPPRGLPPLPMSQTETGALASLPLSTIVNAATDALYRDLFDLVHGEIKIESAIVGSKAGTTTTGSGTAVGESGMQGSGSSGMEGHAAMTVEGKLTAAALGATPFADSSAPAARTAANPNEALHETRKQRMANLSFAQRRHELTRRIVQHTKSIAHVYALTAASFPKSHLALTQQKALKTNPSHLATSTPTHTVSKFKTQESPPRLGVMVKVSSDALQFVKSRWVSQDEAQDALYFHHDSLWKARAHCHDVLGALCVLSSPGRWPDFPTDVALAVDRYATSKEKAYPASELKARLASAVRQKLVLGEVGVFGTAKSLSKNKNIVGVIGTLNNQHRSGKIDLQPLPWCVVLAKGGGSIRLTYGNPRTLYTTSILQQRSADENTVNDDRISRNKVDSSPQEYPIEAHLSVLSEDASAPWKLLSLQVRCSPKTGESDHQLRMNRKQMFDLHRIGERAMTVEEAICHKANVKLTEDTDAIMMHEDDKPATQPPSPIVPRPLYRLFEVAHTFALSLQMEILSSQAEALRRGTWGASVETGYNPTSRGGARRECIEVSPAYFFGQNDIEKNWIESDDKLPLIAVMAVHFWSCDDTYGSPRVCDIHESAEEKEENGYVKNKDRDNNYLPKSDCRGAKRLSLCIRAIATVGLVVSLSGGSDFSDNIGAAGDSTNAMNYHTQRNIKKLLSSIRDPFELSMSDALLAASVICADRRCHAIVSIFNDQKTNNLPPWLNLKVECGAISVAALLSHPNTSATLKTRPYTVLFRLACDSRTGRFIPVFPRPASLLRQLACNDPTASDVQSFRMATTTSTLVTMTKKGGGDAASREAHASREFTGRIIRDAFNALARSMDAMGRKCGVGGGWNDINAQSASLRAKSIDLTGRDVRVSLMNCSAMAAVFGVATIALKISGGLDPVVDMAGGPIKDEANLHFMRAPPLSVPVHQRMIEKLVKAGDGETRRVAQLERESFAVSANASEEALDLVCYYVLTVSECASSVPTRVECAKIEPPSHTGLMSDTGISEFEPASKRMKLEQPRDDDGSIIYHRVLEEAENLSNLFLTLLHQN